MAIERRTREARQLALELPHRPASGRDDFIVGACNAEAVAAIDRWPAWRGRRLALVGAEGSGKSHLAGVWQEVSTARTVAGARIARGDVPALLSAGCLVIEDGETVADEAALFHLLNVATEEGVSLLITAKRPPSQWPMGDPALLSRLATVPCVSLKPPSDDVLCGVLSKLFRDRQLHVDGELLDYLMVRMPRSFAAASALVETLDRASLSSKRSITKRLASEVLGDATDE